jgi:hypothetical protein
MEEACLGRRQEEEGWLVTGRQCARDESAHVLVGLRDGVRSGKERERGGVGGDPAVTQSHGRREDGYLESSRSSFVRSNPWTVRQSCSHPSRSRSWRGRTSTPAGSSLLGVPFMTTAGSLTSKPSDAYSASDCMLKESWKRRMPRARAPRSMTASIRRRPTPCPCAWGSTVIGPTPVIDPRSSRKLEPRIRPSASATTPQMAGCAIKVLVSCTAASSVGKSRGN